MAESSALVSMMTPLNPWETGSFEWSETYYYTYVKDAASAGKADFVDHGLHTASVYQQMTAIEVDALVS